MKRILRLPKKLHNGLSKSGKAHNFQTAVRNAEFFSITLTAIDKVRYYHHKGHNEEFMEITFDSWCLTTGKLGEKFNKVCMDLPKYWQLI